MGLNERVGELLPMLDEAFPANMVNTLEGFLADAAGATDSRLLLVDYDMSALCPIVDDADAGVVASEPVSLHGTDAGTAFTAQVVVPVVIGDSVRVYVPIALRDERLGVLAVTLPDPLQTSTLEGLKSVATTLAYLIAAAARCTDILERARRTRPLSLAAEVQWGLQPLRAFSCPEFSLAGQLVPAYEVGGDNYDWVVNAGWAAVSAVDAMGHGVNASMLGSLAVNAIRNARRAGASLPERVAAADRAVYHEFGGTQFVTAVGLEFDLRTGRAMAVNAGHPAPFRLREGRAEELQLDPQLPIGLFEATDYRAVEVQLRPGDRYLLVSDGVLEATPKGGEEFGETRLEAVLLATADAEPHEAVREIVASLQSYQQGHLRDDATILMLDWRG